ncbi:NAD-dependent epimerase/dehydratase family protein [Natrinema sp. DC36]|uniref:NAD-dependent epimerase/dehydratase family protein n=1 Tax=Natrinema sp. DC36 TaxID=2878680 RepID=UPI001CF0814D|nr:NAD-dependent epimerase/dehydratase family protein [Natrinema sp. DC36]
MRWPVTADEGMSIREAMAQMDRSGSGGIVLVDEENRLVGTATNDRLRRNLRSGVALETPLSAVVNDDPTVIDADETSRPTGGRLSSKTGGDRNGSAASGDRPDATAGDRIGTATKGDRIGFAIERDRTGSTVVPVVGGNGGVDVTVVADDDRPHNGGIDPTAVQTVLVVGGAGYLGSVLCRQLLDDGFDVRVLDPLLYGDSGIADLLERDRFSVIRGDARSVETVVDAVAGVDAVVHLGGIVGDPASELDPRKTLEYNYHSTQLLASLSKYYQINRFLFASSCSVYGRVEADTGHCTEDAPLNPVSLYARLKIQSERVLRSFADGNFSPTILRMATVYGRSPRMRFDLVGNVLPAKAYHEGVVPVFGGDQYRPNVHVDDAARAYVDCLTAPIEDVGDTVFNVGSTLQNYRIDELATIVSDCFPDAGIEYHDDRTDDRSYRVAFDRIADVLGYEADVTVRDHCQELRTAFESGEFTDYTADRYNNCASLEGLDEFERTATVPDHHEPPTQETLPSTGI